ncbi:MAG: AlkA N-terminal domain-containing protein [Porticoccus sp.]|nr:AlkA N-terminal domain-containing protein [Porticoccus sp.]
MLSPTICRKARLSRDARFDGRFFTAVKTTGIFCRSICPASPPQEKNVEYYGSAIQAANSGYRPCLRCRPDSAPGSPAWKGADTTLNRAIDLIDQGALQDGSLLSLAERLGISDRYLRQLFNQHLGVSPKIFALYQQCMFAKQLLHQTELPITHIALASGFKSVRRFNDCFKIHIGLTPSQIRKSKDTAQKKSLQLKLYYRPPYNWPLMQRFFMPRIIPGLEWADDNSYGRTFEWLGGTGEFTAQHLTKKNCFDVAIEVNNLSALKPIVNNIRRILDLDTNIHAVEQNLKEHYNTQITLHKGLRLPGTWSMFEAGIRAILGQQVSVTAAHKLVAKLVETLGKPIENHYLFPTPRAIADSDLSFIKMPGTRKQTLHHLAQHYMGQPLPDNPEKWLLLKGIGPWTVDYARMRGLSDPDIFLGGDLGVKKAVENSLHAFNPALASPWRSYLTFQLWNQH